jgi:hypothetical protein
MTDEPSKEEAERRAREVAQRMLNTPKKPAFQKLDRKSMERVVPTSRKTQKG